MADINPKKEFEEIEYRASDMPIMALHSQKGLEKLQASGKSIPDSTIILAKMKVEDMTQYTNQCLTRKIDRDWECTLSFDIEHGKFKEPSFNHGNAPSRPKLK